MTEARAVWVEGVCATDSAVAGVWTVGNTAVPGFPEALEIAWTVGQEARTLDMLYVQQGHSRVGSTLKLEVELSLHRLRFEDAAATGGLTYISWDAETLEGLLRAFDYHNGVEACWNNTLADDFCSPAF
jgi:hypothetical protein